MSLKVERKTDKRAGKCILHRIADITGGVTIHSAALSGEVLREGTPIGMGENGLYEVVKTATILTAADNTVTVFEVAAGHHFKTGDYFAVEGATGQRITGIEKFDDRDMITLSASPGLAISANTTAFESDGETGVLKHMPVAIVGSNLYVGNRDNLVADAWVIGVIDEATAPAVNTAIKQSLRNIAYAGGKPELTAMFNDKCLTESILLPSDGTVTIAKGSLLEKILIIATEDAFINLTGQDGREWVKDLMVSAGENVITVDIPACLASYSITFSDLAAGTPIILLTRKLK